MIAAALLLMSVDVFAARLGGLASDGERPDLCRVFKSQEDYEKECGQLLTDWKTKVDPSAAYMLGLLFHFGGQVGDNKKIDAQRHRCMKWHKRAAEAGHYEAQFLLATCLKDTDPSESLRWLMSSVEGGGSRRGI